MLAGVLLLSGLACAATPPISSAGSETPASQAAAGSTATADPAMLFRDDFADPTSGWARSKTADGFMDYLDETYHIRVDKPQLVLWSTPGRVFENTRIEVTAKKAGGPDENTFGILCRYQDDQNFYFLLVASDGYYGIGKAKDGQLSLIGTPDMHFSNAIHTGQASNHLRADCDGSTLSLYANEIKLAEVQDADFPTGEAGLIAGTFEVPGVEIRFDDFTIWRP
jgi:hypothetical protein